MKQQQKLLTDEELAARVAKQGLRAIGDEYEKTFPYENIPSYLYKKDNYICETFHHLQNHGYIRDLYLHYGSNGSWSLLNADGQIIGNEEFPFRNEITPNPLFTETEKKSQRERDMRMENEIGTYLEKYFYPRLIQNGLYTSSERVKDKERQVAGIDTILRRGDKTFYVDEKACHTKLNQTVETITLELSYIKDGAERQGWFLRDDLETTHYLFTCLYVRDGDKPPEQFTADSITTAYVALVNKSVLWNFLTELGLTKEGIEAEVKKIRKNGGCPYKNLGQGVRFIVTAELAECPINLAIPRGVIKKLANNYIVKKIKVEEDKASMQEVRKKALEKEKAKRKV